MKWKESFVSILRFYSVVCLQGLRKATRNLSQDIWYPDGGSNRLPSEFISLSQYNDDDELGEQSCYVYGFQVLCSQPIVLSAVEAPHSLSSVRM
jgi:hypothetical protein